jgi:hypothetical protein
LRVRRALAIAAGAAVLFGIVWYVRHVLLTRTPIGGRGESADHDSQPPAPPAGAVGQRDDAIPRIIEQEIPKADEVTRLIASVDWKAFGGAVLAFTQEQERARRERRKVNYDPHTLETLAENNLQMQKIAKLLEIENLPEARFHERVWPSYARGWMKAVGVTLSPAQDAELGEAARAYSRSRAEEGKTLQDSNRLEKLAWDADQGLRWDDKVQKLLSPDQFADYARPAGSDPFWGRQASRHEVPLSGIDDATERVEALWQSALGLDESLRPLVKGAAMEYVREIDRQLSGFRARYPTEAPRDEEIRLRISLLRLQTGAEKALGGRLGLPPEQRQGLDQGSGTVLDWKWK